MASVNDVSAQQKYTNPSELLKELLTWHFYNMQPDQYTFISGTRVMDGPSGHSLEFDGKQDYVILKTENTGKFSSLVVSAWIKPDYNLTSNKFTIVDKQDSFSLYLKQHDTSYYLDFGIYDGSQWHTIESKTAIEPRWTQIVGIFDGNSLSILVNGTNDNSELITSPIFSESLYPQVYFPQSDLIIGADKGSGGFTNLFSGQVDEVNISPNGTNAMGGVLLSESNAKDPENITISSPANVTNLSNTALSKSLTIQSNLTKTNITIPVNVTIPANITITNVTKSSIPSNLTFVPSNLTFVPSNRTFVPSNLTFVPSNLTFVPSNQTQPINVTLPTIPTNLTRPSTNVTLPIVPILSLHFDPNSIPRSDISGNVSSSSGINGTGIELIGSGYIAENIPATNNLSNLTVSAWIKPSYEGGGVMFNVLGKQNSFNLAISNSISGQRTAQFSVYDGIQWHTVTSDTQIPEEWTYLVGRFNGTSISIYVNGVLESSIPVSMVGVNPSGQLETLPIGNLQSDADVLIGAQETGVAAPQNSFAGVIDEVSIYNTPLSASQVSDFYQKFASGKFIPIPIPITPVPTPAESLNFSQNTVTPSNTFGEVEVSKNGVNGSSLSLQGNGFVSQNVTATNNVSNLTLSAWVKPDYSKGSADFTVLSKENEFSLLIHNTLPPQKLAEFSIFDGIQWHTIDSKTSIPQSWTHLAATFNGSAIALYVNGTQESTLPVNTIGITSFGELRTKTVQNLQSDASVLIGAQESRKGNTITVKNLFGGQVDEVNVYNILLAPTEIQQIYNTGANLLQNQVLANATVIPTNKTALIPSNMTVVGNATTPQANVTVPSITNSAISTNATELVNGTAIPITPLITKTSNNYIITQNPEMSFEFLSDQNLKKAGKAIKETVGEKQIGGWSGKNVTITVDVLDPNGNKVSMPVEFTKLRDGKFDIKLRSERAIRAGHYTIKVMLNQNGKSFVTTSDFEWGLVSLNTNKSVFMPGETANFTIIVLDNAGHSVCNSNIMMNILDPSGKPTTLSSGNKILQGSECGIYNAQYTTDQEGNYTVGIRATNPSGTATFNTSFLVENSYPFDIVRTADSKIDPVDNPNSFKVKLDISSYTNASSVAIQETVPSVFNVTTGGTVQTVGDTTTITWNKNLIGNSTSVQYTYSVPLQYPQLYALGPAQITYGSGQVFREARPWFVAVDPAHESNAATTGNTGLNVLFRAMPGPTWTASYSGQNARVLIVTVALNPGTHGNTVNAINYDATATCSQTSSSAGGQVLTRAIATIDTTNHEESEIWYLVNPTTSGKTVCVQLTSGSGAPTRWDTAASTFVNIDGNNPIYAQSSGTTFGSSTTGTGSVSLNTISGNILIDAAATVGSRNISVGTGQTALYTATNNNNLRSVASYKTTSSSTTDSTSVTWSGGSMHYAYSVIELKGPTITLSETLTSSDSISKTYSATRSLSETLTSADAVSRSFVGSRSLSETLTSADAVNRLQNVTQSLPESLTSSDAISATHILPTQTLSETLTSADAVSRLQNVTQSLPEALISSDAVSATHGVPTQTLPETIVSSDTVSSAHIIPVQILSETITSNEIISGVHRSNQTLSESLTSNEGISRIHSVPTQTLSETLASGDAVSRTHGIPIQSISETLTASDALSKITPVSLTESVSISDLASAQKLSPLPTPKVQNPTVSGSGTTSAAIQGAVVSATTISSAAVPNGITMVIPAQAHLTLYQISYDVCRTDQARILVGTTSDILPKINVITGDKLSIGKISADQPFAQYENLTGQHIMIYEAALQPKSNTITVTAINPVAQGIEYVQNKIDITACSNTVFVNELPQVPSPSAPKIFGVTAQVGNGTKMPAESVQYTNNNALTITAIVSSNVTLQNVQIRFANAGQNLTSFASGNMTVQQLNGSRTTYLANGTIPSESLTGPYASYWIWARNNQGLVANSPQYLIGTTPAYPVNATISSDLKPVSVQGNDLAPTIYVMNNSTGPIYGSLALVVNGTVVSQTPGEVFNIGLSATSLSWTVPMSYQNATYITSTRGGFYGTTIETSNTTVATFPPFKVVTLSELGPLAPIHGSLGNIIGEPIEISSSFENQNGYSYRVVSPDGTCVIGQEDSCLVQSVPSGNRSATITLGNQNYTIEYTSILVKTQRFAIASPEPILDTWKVQVEKAGTIQEDMMSKVIVKTRYIEERAHPGLTP
ncbi:MAG: hypothetical protein KGI25_04985 [Thaumarchaeota archaeon]|nr:hypothetical protein [Nitrososphaerota archaeon]